MCAGDFQTFFERHGWVVLRGVVGPEDLARYVAASETVLADERVPSVPDGVPLVPRPSLLHPALAEWLGLARPFTVATECLGAAGVRLLQDALLVKKTHAASTLAWHQDATYFPFLEPADVVSVRLALSHETVASGAIWVRDASHHGPLRIVKDLGEARVIDAEDEAARVLDSLPLELAPGDVSIHHGRTFHASFTNTAATSRRTLVAHVAADHCRVAPDRLAESVRAFFPTAPDGTLDPQTFWPLPRM